MANALKLYRNWAVDFIDWLVRKVLEAQGRSLMVNHGLEPVQNWWKERTFATLCVPQWMRELLGNSQPILIALQEKIHALTLQLQGAAVPDQPRGLGKMTSVIIDREIGDWLRFNNRRQIASYTGLCPGEYSSGNTRLQSCVTKHGNPRLRAALVELACPESFRGFSPTTKRCASGNNAWQKAY